MKTLRIYIENSVVGGYFDDEFKIPTRKLFELLLMSMVNKGDKNITRSLFIKGINKPSKKTEWKFLKYLWNNMRTQENTNQVNIKSL